MNNYVIHSKLGRGKYSHVFEGTDKKTGKKVAIKVALALIKEEEYCKLLDEEIINYFRIIAKQGEKLLILLISQNYLNNLNMQYSRGFGIGRYVI